MNSRAHDRRMRLWYTLTIAVALSALGLETLFTGGIFRDGLARGLVLVVPTIPFYVVGTWHWWGREREKRRGNIGVPPVEAEEKRARIITLVSYGVGVAAVLGGFLIRGH